MTEIRILRLFVALDLSDAFRASLARSIERYRDASPDVRWVPGTSYHLTLRFLGRVRADETAAIGRVLASVAARSPVATVSVTGLGSFPVGSPLARVLWAAVDDRDGDLSRLAAAIRDATEPWAEASSEPFHPHVTLARVAPRAAPPEGWASAAGPAITERSRSLSLRSSVPGPGAPTYEPVARSDLVG